jgi:myosin heavy subunit
MVLMDILNEPEIIFNLSLRYKKNFIFTYIGPTLIVINPYQNLENIFG